jgi:hypothetical protein
MNMVVNLFGYLFNTFTHKTSVLNPPNPTVERDSPVIASFSSVGVGMFITPFHCPLRGCASLPRWAFIRRTLAASPKLSILRQSYIVVLPTNKNKEGFRILR